MAGNDNTRKQEPNGEQDHFSIFMFGNNKQREAYKEGEALSGEEHLTSERERHWADDWFLGNRSNGDRKENQSDYNQIENVLNSIDFDLLMETIDMFVSTTKQLKPFFKEMPPLLHQLRKKLKKP